MEKFKPSEKKSDIYDIGDGLILLNIQTKNAEGVLDRVDTYLGMDGIGFCPVGVVEKSLLPDMFSATRVLYECNPDWWRNTNGSFGTTWQEAAADQENYR